MSQPLKLLSDAPLDKKGREQFNDYRLEPVIETLTAVLKAWLEPVQQRDTNASLFSTLFMLLTDWLLWSSVKGKSTAPRIGLYGGFGQGKSTVIGNVVSSLSPEQPSLYEKYHEIFWGSRILRFDVSFFKADDLEWRFFKALLWQRICLRLFFVLLLFLALPLVIVLLWFLMSGIISHWSAHFSPLISDYIHDWSFFGQQITAFWAQVWAEALSDIGRAWDKVVKLGLGVVLANFLLSFLNSKPSSPTTDLQLAYRDLFIQTLARCMPALPDIVIIDDLDRASVEQQRSFLKAISRYSKELDFAVVVCMDESNILASPPNPEEPEELLRKIITLELRIPDRGREDIVLLAAVCVREFVILNSNQAELCENLSSVQFVSDLCRVLLLEHKNAPITLRLHKAGYPTM